MKSRFDKRITNSYTRQHDQSDCGVACLFSLIKYYGGNRDLEFLRELSGTSKEGTTLLGLEQAANQIGFNAEGCEADIPALIAHGQPVILHVILNGHLHHYVICYAYDQGEFIIGDPSGGISRVSSKELEKIWVTKSCLTLEINDQFLTQKEIVDKKKDWFFSLIKNDIQVLAVSVTLGLAIAILGLAMAVFQKKLIDNILPEKNIESLFIGLIALGFLLLLKSGLSALRSSLIIDQSRAFNIRITGSFLSRLLHMPKAFFDTRKAGDFVARLNDTSRIQRVISQLVGNTFIDAIVTLVTISFLFFFSWKIACISILGVSIYFLILYKYNREIVSAQKAVMNNYAANESQYIDTVRGIGDIKSFNRYDDFLETNRKVFGGFQNSIFHLGRINIKLSFLAGLVSISIVLSILAVGSVQVISEQMELGSLIAILGVTVNLILAVANLAMISIPLNEAKVAFDRMFSFAAIEQASNCQEIDLECINSVELDQITFSFPGRAALLQDVSIELNKGTITTLLGESGSGKSTILQILQKFYSSQGKIIVNNQYLLQEISTTSWRKKVSYVPQNVHIFNGSVLSNITLSHEEEDHNKAIALIEKIGVDKYLNELPQGCKTVIGDGGINLSGGQKQLIAIVRALFQKSEVLLLDEATSAMDREMERYILALLNKLKDEMIIFMVTHQLNIASKSDYIYLLEDTTIHHKGTPEVLMLSNNFYSDAMKELIA